MIQDYQDAVAIYQRAVDRSIGLDATTAGRLKMRRTSS
jgi:hypothetical protein